MGTCQIVFCIQIYSIVGIVRLTATRRGQNRNANLTVRRCTQHSTRHRDRSKADCVVCDIQLLGMSGLELLAAMSVTQKPVSFIMITARFQPALRDEVLRAGANCVLRKPFDSAELFASVERVLEGAKGTN